MIFRVDVDGLGLQRRGAERKKHVDRLNFELAVVQSALQRAPHAGFRHRIERVHHQESAVGAQQRAAAQIHEIGVPCAALVVAAVHGAEKIRVGGNRFENDRALFVFVVRQNHVDAVDAEGIALGALRARADAAFRRRLFVLALAFLEGIEIVEDVVADLFEIFGNLRTGVFFLELLDHAIHQHRSGFLLEVVHFAREFPRERKRPAVNDREFLAELVVFALEFFRGGVFELPVLHHFRDFLDRDHLALEHGENFGQGHGAHLHPAERKLFAGNSPREVVHQFFFAHGEALDDARLLALKGFAFEDLRDAPAQEINARFDFLLESVGQAARQGQQSRAVGVLEIVDVAAVRRGLRLRMQILDHAHDHAAAAGSGKSADEQVVSGSSQFDAHLQRAQGALLAHIARGRLDLGRRFEGNARGIAAPPEFIRRQARVLEDGSSWPYGVSSVVLKGVTLARRSSTSHQRGTRCFQREHREHRAREGSPWWPR